MRRDGGSHVQGRRWLFLPVEHRAAALGPGGERAAGRGENTVSLWNPSPLMRWPKPSWRLNVCAEVATGWEIWELIEMKQDGKGSPSKDTGNKGRCCVQPLPSSLMDLVTKSLSIVWLSQFETPFALPWKIHFMEEEMEQIHLWALVSWQGEVDSTWLTWVPTVTSRKPEERLIPVVEHHIFFLKT